MASSDILGTEKVKKLIFNLGWPAAVNFLVIAVYNITDAIFVGHWLGTIQIAAVVVVGTINFLFTSFGLAVGIGGASIISRALGEKDKEKAARVLGNQVMLVVVIGFLIIITGLLFEDFILKLFGAYGNILAPAKAYYRVLLFGTPFLAMSMMGNNVIQAEGKAKVVVFNSLVPTIVNIILNPVFIKGFNMGIEGAAWATLVAFVLGFLLVFRFFAGRISEISIGYRFLRFNGKLVREITAIGSSVIMNIVATNIFIVLLNKVLFKYQQETGVVIYSIISRVNMIFLVPIIGFDGGIRPIVGYNFGSQQMDRIRDTINTAMKYGVTICYILLGIVFLFANYLISFFTTDPHVVAETLFAMRIVLSFFPLFVIEVIAVAYFQSIGKPQTAFFLTLLRNIILLIPLLYILPYFFGYNGVLYTFPIVDILITLAAIWLLRNELTVKLPQRVGASSI